MDIRKNEKIRLKKENEDLQMCITNIENEINKLRNITASDFTKHQITKEESNLVKKQELLAQNITRFEQVDTGLLDNEIHFENRLVTDEIEKKKNISIEKNKLIKNKKESDKKLSKEYYSREKSDDRNQRSKQKEYARAYNHFVKADNSMPEYMKKNLKNMPNNRGYIWKSIMYFGHKKKQKGENCVSLYERQKGNINAIIEWDKTSYRILHKINNTKKLVKYISRKQNTR
jgi:hypothetical protein